MTKPLEEPLIAAPLSVEVARKPGPTFPALTRTSPWHMLAHDDLVPETAPLKATYHRIHLGRSTGAEHNPTVFVTKGELFAIVRTLHGTHTTNYLARVVRGPGGAPWKLDGVRPILVKEPAGELEDLRMFFWKGRPWAIAATHTNVAAIRQAILEFNDAGTEVLKVFVQPSGRHEKNWMPCADGGDLRLVYSCDPLVTMSVSVHPSAGAVALPSATSIPQTVSHIRGGSQLVRWGQGWLSIVHHVYRVPVTPKGHNSLLSDFWPPIVKDPVAGKKKVVYLHRFAKFDRELENVVFSRPFYFVEIGIEFCAGLVRWEFGEKQLPRVEVGEVAEPEKLVASFGVEDRESWLAEITPEAVEETFVETKEKSR
jgi:hypothetical protein